MAWIKRNLLFVIGSVVALALLGFASFYNYTRWQRNSEVREKINAQHAEFERIGNLNPHPGNPQVDNIEKARKNREALTNVMVRASRQFQSIPRVPATETVTSQDFAQALRRTVDQLRRDSANASVSLPTQYGFSFEAQQGLLAFAPGSLEPLSTQLGEVKAICEIINKAKVNSFDGIRRERVSQDDLKGPQTDYLERNSQTNELSVISPYELSFRCFTPELAEVLTQFANSKYGFVVKSMSVEVSPSSAPEAGAPGGKPTSRPVGGLQVFVTERQLRVTMVLEVVKLIPQVPKA